MFHDRSETVRCLWFPWCEDLTCDWLQHNEHSRHILGVHANIITAVRPNVVPVEALWIQIHVIKTDVPTFNLTMSSCWRFIKRTIGQARIHTGFHPFTEIGRIFHNKYIFNNKNAFQVEIWKMLDSPWLISTTIWKLTLVK